MAAPYACITLMRGVGALSLPLSLSNSNGNKHRTTASERIDVATARKSDAVYPFVKTSAR